MHIPNKISIYLSIYVVTELVINITGNYITGKICGVPNDLLGLLNDVSPPVEAYSRVLVTGNICLTSR